MPYFYLLYAPSRRAQARSPLESRPCWCGEQEEEVGVVRGKHGLSSSLGTGRLAETFNLVEICVQELF